VRPTSSRGVAAAIAVQEWACPLYLLKARSVARRRVQHYAVCWYQISVGLKNPREVDTVSVGKVRDRVKSPRDLPFSVLSSGQPMALLGE